MLKWNTYYICIFDIPFVCSDYLKLVYLVMYMFTFFSTGDPIQPGARYTSIHSTLCRHSEERKTRENPNNFELAVVLTIMMIVGLFMLALALRSACLGSDVSKVEMKSNVEVFFREINFTKNVSKTSTFLPPFKCQKV